MVQLEREKRKRVEISGGVAFGVTLRNSIGVFKVVQQLGLHISIVYHHSASNPSSTS